MPIAILLVLACGPPASPGEWGPYGIGATTRSVVDPRGKTLTIEVWYPAIPDSGEPGPYAPTTLTLDAVREAPPVLPSDGESWPLVGFSHGNVAIRFQSAFLMEHLASHGFVVVAPDHKYNTLLDINESFTTQMLLERPDDIRYAIDAIIADADQPGLLQGMVRDGEWAMMGHSLGAYTALVVGGGALDLQSALDACESGQELTACPAFSPELVAGIAEHGAADDRVVATVAMSPVAWYAFGPDGQGLSQVSTPLILGGLRDEITPYDTEIRPVFDALAPPRKLLEFEGAGHYSFSDICLLFPSLFPECDPDSDFADLEEVQSQTKRAVTAFLKTELEGDRRYRRWLKPDAWSEDEGVELFEE